jgi:hypothetical protein
MNNVFKKIFHRNWVFQNSLKNFLRNNELDEYFNSRRKSAVTRIPLLKTTAESYTGRMYKEFEEEFNKQFSFSCKLLQTEGSILTYTVTHMHSDYGATVVFNKANSTITCACRKYESIHIVVIFYTLGME